MNKLQEKVKKHLLKEWNTRPAWADKAKPNMKPSFLGFKCARRIFYNFLRIQPDYGWEYKNIEIFEKGDAIHKIVQKWLNDCGLRIQYRNKNGKIPPHWKTKEPDDEFPVNDEELNIKNGKLDGVGIIDDELWVYEIKTINQKGWEKYIKKGPKEEHLRQAMIYAFLLEMGIKAGDYDHLGLDEFKDKGVAGVHYIYINRESDTEPWKEFSRRKESAIFMKVIESIVEVKQHVAAKTLPDKTDEFCPWCNFRDKCKREYNPLDNS